MQSERAMATLCFCPPESCAGYASALSARLTTLRSSIAFFSASSFDFFNNFIGAIVIFFKTVMCGNKLKCWKTIPIFCLCKLIFTFLSIRFTPSKIIFPSVGCSKRFKVLRRVDLPLPDGPIITTTSPFLISVETPSNALISPSL